MGCKVPVLFYSDIVLSQEQTNHLLRLKKKYIMLFSSVKTAEVASFCRMENLVSRA